MLEYNKDSSKSVIANNFIDYDSGELLFPLISTQNYEIIQVADSYFSSNFFSPAHKQYCDIELTFVIYNKLFCKTDKNDEQIVKKGCCYLSLKDDIHTIYAPNTCRFQTIAFNLLPSSPYYPLLTEIRKKFLIEDRLFRDLLVYSEFADVLNDFLTDNNIPYKNMLCDSCLTRLLIRLIRYNERPHDQGNAVTTQELLHDVVSYIDTNFLNIKSLIELSDRFGYSYNYLCKIFKEQYKINIQNYFIGKKMEYAKTLLKNKSITDISEMLGYSSPYNFSRAFKKFYGYTPNIIIKK